MKYVIHHRHPITPEQLKQKPFEEIFKNQHEKVDTDEGESTKVEDEYTTSEELTEEYSTFSDMSKKILNQTLMLMRLNIKKIHIHLKHCKTTQQYMIMMI